MTEALSSEITLLQSQSLTSLVQRELESRILSGQFGPGDKLNEVELAAHLKVSRGPVREAFRALEEAGLLRMEKNRGVFVRAVSVEEADEIYELRGVLDEHVGRKLARTITPDGLRELRRLVEALGEAAEAGNVDAYTALNVTFHDRMVILAGNDKLLQTYRRLVRELTLFRRDALKGSTGALPVSTREHRDIVAAIAARDAELAARLMREHVEHGRARMHAVHPVA